MSDTTALTITKHLPVKLDQYRERALSTIQKDQFIEEERLLAHLKNVTESVKQMIKEAHKKQSDAAHALHNGFELAPVSCEQRPDLNRNKLVTVRLDTGETIEERALTKEEHQHYSKKRATV